MTEDFLVVTTIPILLNTSEIYYRRMPMEYIGHENIVWDCRSYKFIIQLK